MLGDNIKIYREQLGISQRELGRRINKTGQFISLIEQGKSNPSIDVFERIAAALEVDISKLLDNENLIPGEVINASSDYFFEQYLHTLGYDIEGDSAEGYIWLKTKEDTYDITLDDVKDLKASSRSFIEFKLHELINKSKK